MKILRSICRFIGHQKNIRFGVRDRIIRSFHNPDTAKSEEFSVPFFGTVYNGNFDVYLDYNVFYYGAYASEELRLIKELLEPISDSTSFDVGANIGHHTLFMSQKSRSVYAFEPFEKVSSKILKKIADNGLKNVEVCTFGLGDMNAVQDYFPPDGVNSGTGSFLSNDAGTKAIQLEIKRGDDFVREKGLQRLDFIKMDVEGFEPAALDGLKETLEKFRPIVFMEWSQNDRNSPDVKTAEPFFPSRYLYYQFISDTTVFKIFRRPTYQLKLQKEQWKDGNILAVPEEYLERVKGLSPVPVIAERLGQK
jgi:FkbM family methyltransferase